MSFPGINLNHAVLTAAAAQVGVPRRHEVMGLPKGWIREEMPRYADMAIFGGSGSSNGRGYDTAYFSPQGHMITTKAELAEALGNKYDLTAFDFQTGKINHALLNKVMQQQELQQKAQRQQHHHHQRSSSHSNGGRKGASHQRQNSSSSYHNGGGGASSSPATVVSAPAPSVVPVKPSSSVSKSVAPALAVPTQDTTLVPPIRQTASIFKQPVSLVKNTRDDEPPPAKRPNDLKSTALEKPRQLFWEKRLAGLRASYPDEIYEPFTLPASFKPVGPGTEDDNIVMASISTSIHMTTSDKAIEGQRDAKKMEKNPEVFCNPDQPLIKATKVSQTDLDKQEARVIETRKRLADAISALHS